MEAITTKLKPGKLYKLISTWALTLSHDKKIYMYLGLYRNNKEFTMFLIDGRQKIIILDGAYSIEEI